MYWYGLLKNGDLVDVIRWVKRDEPSIHDFKIERNEDCDYNIIPVDVAW